MRPIPTLPHFVRTIHRCPALHVRVRHDAGVAAVSVGKLMNSGYTGKPILVRSRPMKNKADIVHLLQFGVAIALKAAGAARLNFSRLRRDRHSNCINKPVGHRADGPHRNIMSPLPHNPDQIRRQSDVAKSIMRRDQRMNVSRVCFGPPRPPQGSRCAKPR